MRKPKKKAGSFIDKLRLDKGKGPSDDPACKMQEFLKKLQDQLKNVNKMLSKWLGAQRAKMAGDDEVPLCSCLEGHRRFGLGGGRWWGGHPPPTPPLL